MPPRDLVFAFLADEEAGGAYGAQWLVHNRPDLFEGCTEAVGEVGGFSLTVAEDQRVYLIETAEKGIAWMRLTRPRQAGARLVPARRQRGHQGRRGGRPAGQPHLPADPHRHRRGPSSSRCPQLTGLEFPEDDLEGSLRKLGPLSRIVGATVRDTANPTMLKAGYKANVIPSNAEAVVDCRVLPGRQEAFLREVDELLGPDVTREWVTDLPPLETTFDGPLVEAMAAALRAEDPGARTVPYMLSGGTDAKHFAELGMRCFGFAPLRLPPGPGLRLAVPRHRRAGAGGRAAVRHPGARPVPADLLMELRGQGRAGHRGRVRDRGGGGAPAGRGRGAWSASPTGTRPRARALADEVGGLALPGDVSDPDLMTMAVDVAEDAFGRLNIVLLNAGITAGQSGVEDLDLAGYRRIMGGERRPRRVRADRGGAGAAPGRRRARSWPPPRWPGWCRCPGTRSTR